MTTHATLLHHPQVAPHFARPRSLLAEILADTAELAAWALLWAVFAFSLASP